MIINIIDKQDSLAIKPDQARAIVRQVLHEENCACDEISLNFVDTPAICELHACYFDDPSPTDCISFPMDEEPDGYYRVLGEIFVCPETAVKYALENQLDAYQETTLYIIHGLLHLMGYDDIEEFDRKQMRQAEKKHLDKLVELKLVLYRT